MGSFPFKAKDRYTLMMKIASQTVELQFPRGFPSIFGEIIKSCLKFQPDKRPEAHQLLTQISSLPPRMSDCDPISPESSEGNANIQLDLEEDQSLRTKLEAVA